MIHEIGKERFKKGVKTIAVVCYFDEADENNDDYEQGNGVDIVGGIEGVISHYVSSKTFVPTVHAPAFSNSNIIDPNLINLFGDKSLIIKQISQ